MMSLKKIIFANKILRNAFSNLFGRIFVDKVPKEFTPYFQYKIGSYHTDYYLYFPKEPYSIRYENEIFNKLHEYENYEIINYLEFHYNAYPDKNAFLKFLDYGICYRLDLCLSKFFHCKLLLVHEWVMRQQRELRSAELKEFFLSELKEFLTTQMLDKREGKKGDYCSNIV